MKQHVRAMPSVRRVAAARPRAVAQCQVLQLVKYTNKEAKFRTDFGNSEHHLTASGNERYAPINKYRVPSQFFHEGDRSFMYFDAAAASDRLLDQKGKLEKLRILQRWMKHILATKQLRQGAVDEAELTKAFTAAHAQGQIQQEDLDKYQDYKTLIDDLFGGLEQELLDNWSFWTM